MLLLVDVAVQAQFLRAAGFGRQQPGTDGGIHAVLGHLAVGGPLAAEDVDHAGVADLHLVAARHFLGGLALVLRRGQRTQAHVDAAHVGPGGSLREIVARGVQDELDFLFQRQRLVGRVLDQGVGGAHHHLAMPGHGKQHAAVRCLGHHQGVFAGQELAVQHQVDALAGQDGGLVVRLVHPQDGIGKHAGGVDHALRLHLEGLAGQLILRRHTFQTAVGALLQRRDGAVVEHRGAMIGGGLCQAQRQTGVVELAVVVADPGADLVVTHPLQAPAGIALAQIAGLADAQLAGEAVIHPQAEGVVRCRPPFFTRDDEGLLAEQVRCIVREAAALAQRLAHQIHIALGQVAHATMHQLGGPAGRTLGKVVGFEQQGGIPTGGGIHRHPEARRTTANHHHIPFTVGPELFDGLVALHADDLL